MGINLNQYNMPETAKSLAPMERCKPDYELLIKRTTEELAAITDFLTATECLERIHLGLDPNDSFVAVVGKLFLHQQSLDRRVLELINLQEKDND